MSCVTLTDCALLASDIPDDEAPPADNKGPLDDALPRPAKRRRLPDASTMVRDAANRALPLCAADLMWLAHAGTFPRLSRPQRAVHTANTEAGGGRRDIHHADAHQPQGEWLCSSPGRGFLGPNTYSPWPALRDLLSMFDMLKKQRMAVQDAKNKGALPPRSLCPLPTTLLTGRRSCLIRQPHKQDGAR